MAETKHISVADDEHVVTTKEELDKLFKEFGCNTRKELELRFWCTYGVALDINIEDGK